MHTILEIIKKSTDYFEKKGLSHPRLEAELLLSHVLNCKRLELYLRFDHSLKEIELHDFRELVKKRVERVPLQYLTGEAPFMDLFLKVGPGVLIPRPETEELLEKLKLKFWLLEEPNSVLDLGTGSGAIAISIAFDFKKTSIVAVDKSQTALTFSKLNIEKYGFKNRITLLHSDWFDKVEGSFDWILANPPYLSEAQWQSAQPEIKKYEPKEALVAQQNGLEDLKWILEKSYLFLNEGGGIAMETGDMHHTILKEVAQSLNYKHIYSWKDLNQFDRFFVAIK